MFALSETDVREELSADLLLSVNTSPFAALVTFLTFVLSESTLPLLVADVDVVLSDDLRTELLFLAATSDDPRKPSELLSTFVPLDLLLP